MTDIKHTTPKNIKLSFQRNAYSRVSFDNQGGRFQEQNIKLLGERENKHGPPPLKSGVDYINPGEDDQMEIYGYTRNYFHTTITWICIVCTAGLLRLVFHWWPEWMLYATHKRCSLELAEKVLVLEEYQQKYKSYYVKSIENATLQKAYAALQASRKGMPNQWEDQAMSELQNDGDRKLQIHLKYGHFKDMDVVRMFRCKKLMYVWDAENGEFFKLHGLDKDVTTATLHQQKGLSAQVQYIRRVVFCNNEIIVPVRSIITLLFLEVLNPFYVFQVFSICLWVSDQYYYYAAAIFFMSALGIISSIVQTRKNQENLRSTVHSTDIVEVCRGCGHYENIPTEHLVPGDVIVIPSRGCVMHCDAALLSGNCIVNESMLTGESVPVTKTPLPNQGDLFYNSKEHARHTLFCGTHVIQTRFYGNEKVLAVVLRTGFMTAKGNLVRSIMYPPPVDFKFEQDSYKFVVVLAMIASIGFIYTVVTKHLQGDSGRDIALDALDLITIVVPPALPAAMTVGRVYAQSRLKDSNIYCISPRTINVSGSVDCVCFDKTGTLTEDGLDMWGVVPVENEKFQLPIKNIDKMQRDYLLIGMVTCHSLTIIDGKLTGDPLDLKMFESTGWALEEPDVDDTSKFDMMFPTVVRPPKPDIVLSSENVEIDPPFEIGIVRQFPFSSSLQRMSVITRTLGGSQFEVFCKGSPEMIVSLSRPETIPKDFSSVLEEYTQEGYRVIALAWRGLPKTNYAKVHRITREEVESGLSFLGLLVMENRLKSETTGIIHMLNDADIRTIMVTGDNMLTALSVARDCGIIPSKGKVIIVHAVHPSKDQAPQLYYTYSEQIGCKNMVGDRGDMTDNMLNVESGLKRDKQPYSFAITGKSWAIVKDFFPDIVPRIVVRGAVFARMSPDQKQQLIQELQGLGYYVAMCGDGANDCGALKAAHAGISLSEAESSVASPFTSKEPNISCVPRVIREGRAALVTSFGIFKYMAAYSLAQFVSVMILYSIKSNLTDLEFLYIDLFLITLFAFFFGKTEAYSGKLVKETPMASLISLSPILSLILQMLVVVLMQWLSFYCIQQYPWFTPFIKDDNDDNQSLGCYENYAIFSVSMFQYIILAVVYSKGAPYRKSLVSNYGLLSSLIIMTLLSIYIIMYPEEWLIDQLELVLPPDFSFRLVVMGFVLVNLVLSAIVEYFIIDFVIFQKFRYRFHDIRKSRRKYLSINAELDEQSYSWPPISKEAPEVIPHRELPASPAIEVHIGILSNDVTFEHKKRHESGDYKPEITLCPRTLLEDTSEEYCGLNHSTLPVRSQGQKMVNGSVKTSGARNIGSAPCIPVNISDECGNREGNHVSKDGSEISESYSTVLSSSLKDAVELRNMHL